MTFPLENLKAKLTQLAQNGVYVGTSSWKYQGWMGHLYTQNRYETRGRFSKSKFEETCLSEYSEVFRTVCFDGGFYQFPSPASIEKILSQVPSDFRLSIKVTEDVTSYHFPDIKRYGNRAGTRNPSFLDAFIFNSRFLSALEPFKNQIGTIIFEFGHLPFEGDKQVEFLRALDEFLRQLPSCWDYSIEIRNHALLSPEYFEVLRRNRVAHVFNSWTRMPPVREQLTMPGSFTAEFATARFLLRPGRRYEQAVEAFSPYTEIKDPYPEGQAALVDLLSPVPTRPTKKFISVNNRLEGSALGTISQALQVLSLEP
jgi:uncharacterized protein YecE (DUF72 family)